MLQPHMSVMVRCPETFVDVVYYELFSVSSLKPLGKRTRKESEDKEWASPNYLKQFSKTVLLHNPFKPLAQLKCIGTQGVE